MWKWPLRLLALAAVGNLFALYTRIYGLYARGLDPFAGDMGVDTVDLIIKSGIGCVAVFGLSLVGVVVWRGVKRLVSMARTDDRREPI